jgi:hypothetical protein
MIKRFNSFNASNDVDTQIDSFVFELINMKEADVKEAVRSRINRKPITE